MRTVSALSTLLLLAASPLGAADEASFWSSLDADLYGYFKLDFAYDTAAVVDGDYAKWVAPASADGGDFSGTVNQTRLGLDVSSSEKGRIRATGRVEIDFYGGKEDPDPRIRHAFVEISWPEAGAQLLVGQTSDVISPLNPPTLNYTVAWWAGNIGFRRPQLRLTKALDIGGFDVLLEGALTHNIYDTRTGSLTGEDAGFPALQARASLTLPVARRTVTIGLSGHRAEEDFEVSAGRRERVDSWSLNLDLAVSVSDRWTFMSELFSGASLAPYLGGVGQGIDSAPLAAIESRGGWAALSFKPARGRLRYALGASLEDVDSAELDPGSRGSNRSIFGNAVYRFTKKIDAGLELSHWRTAYTTQDDKDAFRVQTSFYYKF